MALFGTFLGALADGVERRLGLTVVLLMSLATTVALATLAWFDVLGVWPLAVGSFLNGMAWASDNPFRRIMLGDVVGNDRLGTAMSLDVGANNACRMLGPAIGGLLLATTGIVGCFVLGAILYVAALVATAGLRYRNNPDHHASGDFVARIVEGLKLAQSNRRLRATLIVTIIFNLFGWPFTSMIPVIGQDHLHLGPIGVGVLASLDGVGACLGAVVIAVFVGASQYYRVYIGGVIVYMVALTLFALAPNALLAGAALLVTGLGGAAFAIMQATLVYLSAPPEMRGRLLGVLATCIGIGPIGFVHIGLLAEAVGAQSATVIVGLEGLLVMILTRGVWREAAVDTPAKA
jgi:MFS family permease